MWIAFGAQRGITLCFLSRSDSVLFSNAMSHDDILVTTSVFRGLGNADPDERNTDKFSVCACATGTALL